MGARRKLALQFKIELLDIEPMIWRRIEVPSTYSFWDLHVAIQDAMGWLDYHLHEFSIKPPRKRNHVFIGIPDEEDDHLHEVLPGWELPVGRYLASPGDECSYSYDFGDNWRHLVVLEGVHLQEKDVKYPICTDGERACPVEDCGGVPGYYRLIEILADAEHEEHEGMLAWLQGHAKNYHPYDPARFEPTRVEFWNPKKRLQLAFGP